MELNPFEQFITLALAASVVVTNIVETFKTAGLSTKYAPLLSMVLGVGVIFLLNMASGLDLNWAGIVLAGLMSGLTSSGQYSFMKKNVDAKVEEEIAHVAPPIGTEVAPEKPEGEK